MTDEYDDILDGLFHACAWAAYLDQAAEEQGWPDPEATRRRAYAYYEKALAEKNRHKSRPDPVDGPGPVSLPECARRCG
jgi:hypothetical protein